LGRFKRGPVASDPHLARVTVGVASLPGWPSHLLSKRAFVWIAGVSGTTPVFEIATRSALRAAGREGRGSVRGLPNTAG
jgi:hypothetical protein